MTEIGLLKEVGLQDWFIILAAIVFILERIGLFKTIFSQISDRREFEQEQAEADSAAKASEQVALWSQMTQLQTMLVQQSELLHEYIVDASKNWHPQHDAKLTELAERQMSIIYEIKQLNTKFTLMVGLVENEYEKRQTTDDG